MGADLVVLGKIGVESSDVSSMMLAIVILKGLSADVGGKLSDLVREGREDNGGGST